MLSTYRTEHTSAGGLQTYTYMHYLLIPLRHKDHLFGQSCDEQPALVVFQQYV